MVMKMNIFNENLYTKMRKLIGTLNMEFKREWGLYESGKKDMPTNLAEKFAKIHYSEELVDLIINNIKEKINYKEGDLLHGSKYGIRGKIHPRSSDMCDFGTAFYVGEKIEQVLTLICHTENATIYKLKVTNFERLKKVHFSVDDDWALFILTYRGYMPSEALYEYYKNIGDAADVVIGCIADDKLFEALNAFARGFIRNKAFIKMLEANGIGIQYAFKTQKACDSIEILDSYKLTPIEKAILQAYQKNLVEETKKLIDDILDKYSNDGDRIGTIIKRKESEL